MKKLFVSLLFALAPVAVWAQSAGTFAVEAKPVDQYYSYNFGSVNVGFRMFADFTLTAKSDQVVELKRITIAGAMYEAQSNCPSILPPGQACTTRVFFWPRFEGPHWGRLTFELKENNFIVDLFGQGWAH